MIWREIMSNNYYKNKRPKLNIPKSSLERILGFTSGVGVLITWLYLIVSWPGLFHKIPTHFNFLGRADSWGGRGSVLIAPIFMSVLYIILTVTSRFPESFNYMVNITEENARRQYQNARTFIVWLKTEITFMFLYLEWQSIQVSISKSIGLGVWFLPVFFIILFGTIGVYIRRMFRLK
jgi:hypothetical protein